ncbi:MAG: DUF5667 domain-containing protein [Anaerolineales bacterium]|nr:DUF5667 domain-containing protein [Anaerolineales bacterium]
MTYKRDPLEVIFDANKDIPERDPQSAARGRSNFLREASELRARADAKYKMGRIWRIFSLRKKTFAMNFLIVFIVIFILLFSGGSTVYASQDAMPNQPLYSVKTFSEDVAIAMTVKPSAHIERLLELSQRRVDEMAELTQAGIAIPAPVTDRLQRHIEECFQTAIVQNDDDLRASLLRVYARLQTEEQTLAQLETRADMADKQAIEKSRMMIQERLQITEKGIADPQQFRNALQRLDKFNVTSSPTVTSIATDTPQVIGATSVKQPQFEITRTPGMGTPAPKKNNCGGSCATHGVGENGLGNGNSGGNGSNGRKP